MGQSNERRKINKRTEEYFFNSFLAEVTARHWTGSEVRGDRPLTMTSATKTVQLCWLMLSLLPRDTLVFSEMKLGSQGKMYDDDDDNLGADGLDNVFSRCNFSNDYFSQNLFLAFCNFQNRYFLAIFVMRENF